MDDTQGFATRAIHAGQEPEARTGAVVPAIYQVSTYKQDGVGGLRDGYEYSRAGNPTRDALDACLASLEGAEHALTFASGLAAEDTIVRGICKPGDRILFPSDAYGGSIRMFQRVLEKWQIEAVPLDLRDLDALEKALEQPTAIVWCETPTNPRLNVINIAAVAERAHAAGAKVVVDNTFATPVLQQPLAHGADVVTHSTTKYIGGHSDVIGGALMTNDDALMAEFQFLQLAVGAVPGPFDAWLTLRGVKTLDVRMQRHCDNAEKIVEFLAQHPRVEHVFYPGRDSDLHQMARGGGMVSFLVAGGEEAAKQVCAATGVFILGESLGGVESLIELPAAMTHAGLKGTELEVPTNLIRLSVGIETEQDLIADLAQALG